MPPTVPPITPDLKGRKETLSPTPRVSQSVQSAIELTVKDLEPSEQRIIDKCGEADFQLSNHRDWNQPNHDCVKIYVICCLYYINQGSILRVFQILKNVPNCRFVAVSIVILFSIRLM